MAVLVALCSLNANAYDAYIDGIYYNLNNSDNTASVTKASEWDGDYSGDVIIPVVVEYNSVKYDVTSISESAFQWCEDLTSISLPDGITSIGDCAFSCCSGLTSIIIPNSVTSIGKSAFEACYSLTSIIIPGSVTHIGNNFLGCTGNMTSIIVDSKNAFYDSRDECNAIIETASNKLIAGCKKTVIPNSVISIDKLAFFCCEDLVSIIIPQSITSIGDSAFMNCGSLTSITIPNSVTSIGVSAFQECLGLTSITIPNSVTSIGESAFYRCSGLTSITIPNSVSFIDESAFGFCSNLTSIQVEDGNSVYDSRNNCNAIIETSSNSLIIGCKNTNIPEGITSIGSSAFQNCRGLTSIYIPNSVTEIGPSAFSGCRGLTSIQIPNSVTEICESAFNGCSNLRTADIPNGITIIANSTFNGCRNLTTVVLPNSVKEIGDHAFSGCGLTIVYCYAENVPEVNDLAFNILEDAQNATLYVPATSIDAYASAKIWKDFGNISAFPIEIGGLYYQLNMNDQTAVLIGGWQEYMGEVIIPESVIYKGVTYSVTEIGNSAFLRCYNLTSVVIPEGVTKIGKSAFYGCDNLISVVIPKGVTTIGKSAFYGCYSMTSVIIPEGVTSIGEETFLGCGLTSMIIPESVRIIEPSAFSQCNLTSITIPGNVMEIGKEAFHNCYSLNSITISKSVASIGDEAFAYCSSLNSVTCCTAEVPKISTSAFRGTRLSRATLHVPFQSLEDYKSTTPWSGFGTFVAMTQMELELEEGWNWISHNAANGVIPTDIFGENVLEVKSQTKGLIRDTKYGIVGNLTELMATEAYKVKTSEADTEPYVLTGDLFDATNAITLKQGWNWMGYPMADEAAIEDALKDFEPMEGDYIVGFDNFTSYTNGEWKGTLTKLTPGEGYMYKSGETKSVHFSKASSEAKAREAKARKDSEDSQWTCDIHKYPNRMPTIARLYIKDVEADASDYDVAAFCGDECRGVGKVVKGVVMMNVCGEGDETITFKALDRHTGIVMDIMESVPFTGDVLGAYTEPFKLSLGGESATRIELVDDSQLPIDDAAIYNVSGQRIKTLQKGVNIIRMKDGKTKKVFVK